MILTGHRRVRINLPVPFCCPDASEGGADGSFTFTRTGDAATALEVHYGMITVVGMALPSADYEYVGGTFGALTFAAGSSTATLAIHAVDDSLVEGTETVGVSVTGGSGYRGDPMGGGASIALFDNDVAAAPPVSIASTSLGSITGVVWNDAIDPDGIQDDDEPGIAGQWVYLTSYGGVPIASVQASANGVYTFTGLADGEYGVEWISDGPIQNISAPSSTTAPAAPPPTTAPVAPVPVTPAPVPPASGPAQPADVNGLYVPAGDRIWWEAAAGGAEKIAWKRVEIDGVERYQLTADRAGTTFENIVAALRSIGINDNAVLGTITNRIYGDLASPLGRPNAPFSFELKFSNTAQPYAMADIAPDSIGKTLATELDAKFLILKGKLDGLIEQGGPIKPEDTPTFLKGVVRGFFDDGLVGDIKAVGSLLEGAWKVLQVQSKVTTTVLIAGHKTLVEQSTNFFRGNFTEVFHAAVDNVETTANTYLSSEIAFAGDTFKQVVELNMALTGIQIQVLLEIGRYFEAQMKGQTYEPSAEAQKALKIVGLIAVDLGITALDAATPENLGRLYGWIAYQVVQTVVLDVATAGAAEALRAGKLAAGLTGATDKLALLGLDAGKITRLFERLKSLGQSATVLTEVEKAAQRAAETARAVEALKAGRRSPLMMVEGKLAGGCFAPGTMLLTPTGYRAIEDFRAGDAILTRDERNPDALLETGVVAQSFRRYAGLMSVCVEGRWLRLTAEHPFWIAQGWVEAHTLRVGDRVLGADGRWLTIEGVRDAVGHEVVYNLEVRDAHTFFVGAEDWGFAVWVHNLTPDQCARLGELRATKPNLSAEGLEDLLKLEKLQNEEYIHKIANGHAYDKHIVENNEFPGVHTKAEFAEVIGDAVRRAEADGSVRNLQRGRTAYYDDTTGLLVIKDPVSPDLGTAFKPLRGRTYFSSLT